MITVEHLTKYYGDHLAVDDLSFEISDGHVYGFLGPNGAGKSTTMNIMTGCLSATEGSILIDGHDIFDEPNEAKRLIGYLPEQPPLYMNESPMDYLSFVAKAKGLKGPERKAQIERVMKQTGIESVKNRRISTLSKGYKQRVGIAQALLGNPSVIILDEPTVGLDPLQIIEIRDLIKSLGESHTVIFSSHILSEVQAICDQILMISKGKLVAFNTPENLENELLAPNEIDITTDATYEQMTELFGLESAVLSIAANGGETGFNKFSIKTDLKDIYQLSKLLFDGIASKGLTIYEMNLKKANLEDIFLELNTSHAGETPENGGEIDEEEFDGEFDEEFYEEDSEYVDKEGEEE